jgi:hypothetical protein
VINPLAQGRPGGEGRAGRSSGESRALAQLPLPLRRAGAPARAADFVSQLPTPGKQVCLRQALAFEPPTAEMAYAVDLAGKYWAGRWGARRNRTPSAHARPCAKEAAGAPQHGGR